jgi:hypothetical protein
MGYPTVDIFHNPRLERILRGIKRFYGQSSREKRLAITGNILIALLRQLPNHTTDADQANLYAAFCTAFSGFLRVGKFTYTARDLETFDFSRWHITDASLNFHNGVSLTLPSSKTDPFRIGVTIHMPVTNDEACPKTALLNLSRFNHPGPRRPLFQRSNRHSFTRDYAIDSLRSLLTAARIPGHFSGHWFRRRELPQRRGPASPSSRSDCSGDGNPMPSGPTWTPTHRISLAWPAITSNRS